MFQQTILYERFDDPVRGFVYNQASSDEDLWPTFATEGREMLRKVENEAPGLTLYEDFHGKVQQRGIFKALADKIKNDSRLRRIDLGINSSKLTI